MTVITVHYPEGRIDRAQRASLAVSLTDAVLDVECGQIAAPARAGFQVHFRPLAADGMAIGGRLVADAGIDAMLVDVAVMDGYWPPSDRKQVIENLYSALCRALALTKAPPSWCINFRVIDEGSWGSRGRVLSVLDLLATGAFTPERAEQIRRSIGRSGGA